MIQRPDSAAALRCDHRDVGALTPATTKEILEKEDTVPIKTVLPPPSMVARYGCASVLAAVFAVWGKFTFVDEDDVPGGSRAELHGWGVPLAASALYLVSLPILTVLSRRFLLNSVDVKLLLKESMVLYNAGQVLLNGWTVYRILDALLNRGHPFIGGPVRLVDTGASYAVWVHYCDKYLEFMDTYFMVLRGKMDQVSSTACVSPGVFFGLLTLDRSGPLYVTYHSSL